MANEASIDYFKQNFLKYGLAKPSRYRVEFANVQDGGRSQSRQDIMPAETVTLPTRSFIVKEEQWFGPKRDIPVGNNYAGDVVITFPVSGDQSERTFFEGWMDEIVPPHMGVVGGDGEQYNWLSTIASSTTMKIKTLNELNEVTSTYTLHEAYPNNIFPISLGANMFNDYTRLQVSFRYRSYTYEI